MRPPSDLIELLGHVPVQSDQDFMVRYIDMAKTFQAAGLAFSGLCNDDAVDDYDALAADVEFRVAPLSWLFNLTGRSEQGALAETYGFSFCELTAVLTAEPFTGGPPFFAVDAKSIDIVERASANIVWADRLTVEQLGGYTVLDWGEERDPARAGPLRALGSGGQIAVSDDGVVVATAATAVMAEVVDESVPRLLDGPHVRAVATALSEFHVYTAIITEAHTTDLGVGGPVLERWSVLGLGAMQSVDGVDVAIAVLAHDTEEAAIMNEELLQRRIDEGRGGFGFVPWTELLNLRSIRRDGLHVVAEFEGADPQDISPFRLFVTAWSARAGGLFDTEPWPD